MRGPQKSMPKLHLNNPSIRSTSPLLKNRKNVPKIQSPKSKIILKQNILISSPKNNIEKELYNSYKKNSKQLSILKTPRDNSHNNSLYQQQQQSSQYFQTKSSNIHNNFQQKQFPSSNTNNNNKNESYLKINNNTNNRQNYYSLDNQSSKDSLLLQNSSTQQQTPTLTSHSRLKKVNISNPKMFQKSLNMEGSNEISIEEMEDLENRSKILNDTNFSNSQYNKALLSSRNMSNINSKQNIQSQQQQFFMPKTDRQHFKTTNHSRQNSLYSTIYDQKHSQSAIKRNNISHAANFSLKEEKQLFRKLSRLKKQKNDLKYDYSNINNQNMQSSQLSQNSGETSTPLKSQSDKKWQNQFKLLNIAEYQRFGKDIEYKSSMNEFHTSLLSKDNIIQYQELREDKHYDFSIKKNQSLYFKINTKGKQFPLKMRFPIVKENFKLCLAYQGKNPSYQKKQFDLIYEVKKDCLYKIEEPQKLETTPYIHICIFSKNDTEISLKYWYTDLRLDIYKNKSHSSSPKPVKSYYSKNEFQDELTYMGLDKLHSQIKEIYKKRKQIKKADIKSYSNKIEKNMQRQFKSKKSLEAEKQTNFLKLQLNIDNAQNKKHQLDEEQRQEKIIKLLKTEMKRKYKIQQNSIQKYHDSVNKITFQWLAIINCARILDSLFIEMKLSRLMKQFYKGNKRYARLMYDNYRERVSKQCYSYKTRLFMDVRESMQFLAVKIKERQQPKMRNIVQLAIENGKSISLMNKLEKKSRILLESSSKIQIWFRQQFNREKIIALGMIEGLLKTIKEDYENNSKFTQVYTDLVSKLPYMMNKKKQQVAYKLMAYYNRDYAIQFYKYRLNVRRMKEIKELELDIAEASEMTNKTHAKKKNQTLRQKLTKNKGAQASEALSKAYEVGVKESNLMIINMQKMKKRFKYLQSVIDPNNTTPPSYLLRSKIEMARSILYAFIDKLG